jgi:hypothetical protein
MVENMRTTKTQRAQRNSKKFFVPLWLNPAVMELV